jgi:hypothetical protein
VTEEALKELVATGVRFIDRNLELRGLTRSDISRVWATSEPQDGFYNVKCNVEFRSNSDILYFGEVMECSSEEAEGVRQRLEAATIRLGDIEVDSQRGELNVN